jgi:hypothetical protein
MNRQEARKYLRELAEAYIEASMTTCLLEYEIFGGSVGDVILTDPKAVANVEEACRPENVQAWVEENKDKPIVEKGDRDPFDTIVKTFLGDICTEDNITDEWADACIAALQKHHAGCVMFGTNGTDRDHLFVYEPDPAD